MLLQTGDCCVDKNVSLFNLVKEWCKHLDPKCFDQLYSDGTEKVLQLFQNVNTDEDFFITKLARITTGLPIEDWNLKTIELYKSSIGKFIKTAQAFVCNDLTEDGNTTSNYQIIFADTEGHGMTRIFDRVDVSARGKLLFNQLISSLDAMGHSISKQEKRQILMDVLKKLC